MNAIPTYALYGELSENLPPERLHCESIAERSRLYDWEIQPHRHEAFFQILHIRSGSGEARSRKGTATHGFNVATGLVVQTLDSSTNSPPSLAEARQYSPSVLRFLYVLGSV